MDFYIVYPEERWVSAEQIDQWYSDAIANNLIDEPVESDDIFAKAQALTDIGHITLATPPASMDRHGV